MALGKFLVKFSWNRYGRYNITHTLSFVDESETVMTLISVSDAAEVLSVSETQVRALIRTNELEGVKVNGVTMVDADSVINRSSGEVSKPIDASSVWDAALSMEEDVEGTPAQRHRYRKRLTDKSADHLLRALSRRKETTVRFNADRDDIRDLLGREDTFPTGTSAYDPSSCTPQMYVTDLDRVAAETLIIPSQDGNLELYTLPEGVTPKVSSSGGLPRLIVAADAACSRDPYARAKGRDELELLSKNPMWMGNGYAGSRYTDPTPEPDAGDGECLPPYHVTDDPFTSALHGSGGALSLWAKTDYWNAGSKKWGLLITHLSDAGRVAAKIWDTWLSENTKNSISNGTHLGESLSRKLIIFLAATHDVGKASPAFQQQANGNFAHLVTNLINEGFKFDNNHMDRLNRSKPRHEDVSMYALARAVHNTENSAGIRHARFLAAVVGAHHGRFPTQDKIARRLPPLGGGYSRNAASTKWIEVQDALVIAAKKLSGITDDEWQRITVADIDAHALTLISGVVVMADWISSNTDYFPLGFPKPPLPSAARTETAWSALDLSRDKWSPEKVTTRNVRRVFRARFPGVGDPRPAQVEAVRSAQKMKTPGLLVLEAPTGCGKTEAALLAAECMANKFGCDGVLFALPTRATSNATYTRVNQWLSTQNPRLSAHLTHGKAEFNEEFSSRLDRFTKGGHSSQASVHDSDEADCCGELHTWFDNPRAKHLADFTVGTVDQVLLASAVGKHLSVRHLGLSGKVVILDEVHASDTYMASFLVRTLRWLGRMGVPVIALTATLTPSLRRALHNAYSGTSTEYMTDPGNESKMDFPEAESVTEYPVISYSTPLAGTLSTRKRRNTVKTVSVAHHRTRAVSVHPTHATSVKDIVDSMLPVIGTSGCSALIFNTVVRAQEAFEIIKGSVPDTCEVIMVHSRFTGVDRANLEAKVLSLTGKDSAERPKHLIVISTQVIEQSLDVDFDVMYTDLAPMDLLVQRMGRLHRHPERDNRDPRFIDPTLYVGGYHIDDNGVVQIERTFTVWVYRRLFLMRTAYMLENLTEIVEPQDLPELMRKMDKGVELPDEWSDLYRTALVEYARDTPSNLMMSKRSVEVPRDNGIPWRTTPDNKRDFTPVRAGVPNIEVVVAYQTEGGLVLPKDGGHGQGWRIDGSIYPDLVKAVSLRAVPLDVTTSKKVRSTGYGSSKRESRVPAAVLHRASVPLWETYRALQGLGLLILTPDDATLTSGYGVIEGTNKKTGEQVRVKVHYDPENGLRRVD